MLEESRGEWERRRRLRGQRGFIQPPPPPSPTPERLPQQRLMLSLSLVAAVLRVCVVLRRQSEGCSGGCIWRNARRCCEKRGQLSQTTRSVATQNSLPLRRRSIWRFMYIKTKRKKINKIKIFVWRIFFKQTNKKKKESRIIDERNFCCDWSIFMSLIYLWWIFFICQIFLLTQKPLLCVTHKGGFNKFTVKYSM